MPIKSDDNSAKLVVVPDSFTTTKLNVLKGAMNTIGLTKLIGFTPEGPIAFNMGDLSELEAWIAQEKRRLKTKLADSTEKHYTSGRAKVYIKLRVDEAVRKAFADGTLLTEGFGFPVHSAIADFQSWQDTITSCVPKILGKPKAKDIVGRTPKDYSEGKCAAGATDTANPGTVKFYNSAGEQVHKLPDDSWDVWAWYTVHGIPEDAAILTGEPIDWHAKMHWLDEEKNYNDTLTEDLGIAHDRPTQKPNF